MPPEYRMSMFYLMVLLHIGISVTMSKMVGLAFTTALPSYVLGFSCRAGIGSAEWWVATAVAIGPTVAAMVLGKLLPEDWPSSPCPLFMWNGKQARALLDHLMTQDMRVVMATETVMAMVSEERGG